MRGKARPTEIILEPDLSRCIETVAREECEPAGCGACPLRSCCQPPVGIGLWELTEKGRRLLT